MGYSHCNGHSSAAPDAATSGAGSGRQWEARGGRRRGRRTRGRGGTALALGLQLSLLLSLLLLMGGAEGCTVDKDCRKREVCKLEAGASSGQCVCHEFLYGAMPPSCIQVTAVRHTHTAIHAQAPTSLSDFCVCMCVSQPGAMETVAMVLVIATFGSAWSHYLLAFKDHMCFPRPQPVHTHSHSLS